MADQFINLLNVKEIQDAIKKVPFELEKKYMRNATSDAMKPVTKQARISMRKISPTIAKAIGVRTKQYAGGTTLTVVGIKTGTKPTVKTRTLTRPDGSTFEVTSVHDPRNTAHLVELGTKAHKVRIPWLNITVAHPGTKAEHPILNALKSESDKSLKIFKERILGGLDRIVEKEKQKAKKASK